MAIDFKTFLQCVPHITAQKLPILVRGKHGIGKSEGVYQIAKGLGMPIVERRASQMTEGDLMGLPSIADNSTTWNPPDWFRMACDSPVVLFLDEIDRASIEVRQGIFELTDSRKLNGHHLHPETLIFGAINGGEHASQYQVGEMDPAEADRWVTFDIEPTVEDWLKWATDNVDSLIWDFINQTRAHLEHGSDFEPGKIYPSRRSWKRLNDALVGGNLLEEANPVLFNVACGFVGFEAAIALNDFIETYDRVVTVEDLLIKGKLKKTKEFTINDHVAMVEKIVAEKFFHKHISQEEAQNTAEYFVTMPSEVAMVLWNHFADEGVEVKNSNKLHKCKLKDGSTVIEYFIKVLSGHQKEEKD
jgi:hypothetical protein